MWRLTSPTWNKIKENALDRGKYANSSINICIFPDWRLYTTKELEVIHPSLWSAPDSASPHATITTKGGINLDFSEDSIP